jgi:uncharacterized membrane protein
MSTRKIVVVGVLIAITILMTLTGIAFIPVPSVANATILHIPAIIGGVLEGPLAGLLVGLGFGLSSWVNALSTNNALFSNPIVAIVPRLFIGVVAALVYNALRKNNDIVAMGAAGVAGALTNTVLVVGALILFGLIPAAVIGALIPQIIAELVVAAIITIAVVAAWKRIDRGAGKSSI